MTFVAEQIGIHQSPSDFIELDPMSLTAYERWQRSTPSDVQQIVEQYRAHMAGISDRFSAVVRGQEHIPVQREHQNKSFEESVGIKVREVWDDYLTFVTYAPEAAFFSERFKALTYGQHVTAEQLLHHVKALALGADALHMVRADQSQHPIVLVDEITPVLRLVTDEFNRIRRGILHVSSVVVFSDQTPGTWPSGVTHPILVGLFDKWSRQPKKDHPVIGDVMLTKVFPPGDWDERAAEDLLIRGEGIPFFAMPHEVLDVKDVPYVDSQVVYAIGDSHRFVRQYSDDIFARPKRFERWMNGGKQPYEL